MLTDQNFNWKQSEKELEKPSTPSIDTLIEFVENLQIREEIKVYNWRNMKWRIQRKKLLEFEKKEIEITLSTRKVWQKEASPPTSPLGDDDQTQGMDSLAQDEKLEPLPWGTW